MNYAWARDFTLQLIHQYTIAGNEISPGYNNQADYINRIPKLLDDAQVYVATTTHKIREVVPLGSLSCTEQGAWRVFTLPDNCWQLCSGGLIRFDGPRMQRYHRYHLVGSSGLAVPRELDGELSLEYYRYPQLLGSSPPDGAELDNTVAVQFALPYYAAAHLAMLDNAFAYSALYNEFEAKLARLGEQLQTELNITENVYDARDWRYDA